MGVCRGENRPLGKKKKRVSSNQADSKANVDMGDKKSPPNADRKTCTGWGAEAKEKRQNRLPRDMAKRAGATQTINEKSKDRRPRQNKHSSPKATKKTR